MKRAHGYLTFSDREWIEQLWRDGATQKEIAQKLGVHYTTVYEELKRGENGLSYADHRMAYSADLAQRVFLGNLKKRGRRKHTINGCKEAGAHEDHCRRGF